MPKEQRKAMPRRLIHLLFAFAVVALAGCTTLNYALGPYAFVTGPTAGKRFFVVESAQEAREIDRVIVEGLKQRGYDTGSGAEADMPQDTAIVVAYVDHWQNEILESLTITLRDPQTGLELAKGNSSTTPGNDSSVEARVDEALERLFTP
jgi:hypothetical protein